MVLFSKPKKKLRMKRTSLILTTAKQSTLLFLLLFTVVAGCAQT
jgi:hypothetical protein